MSNTETQIIFKDGNSATLDGKPVEFLPIQSESLTSVLVKASEVADIGEAVTKAIEEAKRKGRSIPFGVLEIATPLSHLKHPTDPNLHVIGEVEYYGFDLHLYYDVVVQSA